MTEILAPAGSMEALKAAIANGADAIYLGGKNFSARAFADNFDLPELTQALALAHFYGVKIYLTINTLLAEDELPAVVDYLAEVEKIGIDAVIIQDLGLLRILGEAFPALPIHASTQMTIFNSAGVNFLAEYGVKRAILARELSLKELAASKKHSKIELESFVHGALCISYSGQCLLSSMIGARSGNRGRCAQPCRLNYSLLDEKHNVLGADLGEYILSPKDLYGYLSLEDIFALDLSSWKIEGRMKRPEYVAIVTSVYRRALDSLEDKSLAVDQQEGLRRLLQVFNRDYCAGFWHGDPGRDYMSLQRPNNRGLFLGRIQKVMGPQMEVALENDLHKGDGLEIWVKVGGRLGLTVGRILLNGVEVESASAKDIVVLDIRGKISPGDRIFKTADALLLAEARDSWENLPDLPLRIKITAKIDQPLFLEAEDGDGFRASYEEDFIVPRALKTPTSQEMIREQLARLGGSHYYLQNLDYDLDEEIMLPKSILNNSRRSLVEFLQQERRKVFQRENSDKDLIYQLKTQLQAHKREKPARKNSRYDNYAANLLLTALSDDEDVLLAAAKNGVRQAYLTGENFAPQKKRRPIDQLLQQLAKENCRLIPSLPRIFHESQNQYWLQEIEKWQKAGVDGILAPTVNALGLLKMAGWQGDILGDSTMNIFNSQALHWCREANLSTVHLSSELTLEQIKVLAAFTKRDLALEFTVHGALNLMISEYCPLGALAGGKTADKACSRPCREKGLFYLQDRKDYCFPCRADENCRLHLFNAKEICLLEDLPALSKAGIDNIRLDMRLYQPVMAGKIAALYSSFCANNQDENVLKEEISLLLPDGYTKGHLYRGI